MNRVVLRNEVFRALRTPLTAVEEAGIQVWRNFTRIDFTSSRISWEKGVPLR